MNKLERLLSMTIYFINHGRVSATKLAQHYDVSLRTIQRDVNTLTLAGIPVIAYTGVYGGYEIMEQYRMHLQLANADDYAYISTALQGYMSAICDNKIRETWEKVDALHTKQDTHRILDFGVLQETPKLNTYLQIIEECIQTNHAITFRYCNAQKEVCKRNVEPCYVIYRWYTWYMLAFDLDKMEYRCFKCTRMWDLMKGACITQHHTCDQEILMQRMFGNDQREYYDIVVDCKSDCDLKYQDYLNGTIIEVKANQDDIMQFSLPKDEDLWKGTFLIYADKIEILSPNVVRDAFIKRCMLFLQNHDILVS